MAPDIRLPLLAGQRAIWLADRANPFPGRFINAQATVFLGELDCDIFTRAAELVVAETECLRLHIHEDANGPTQGILPPSGAIRLPILDFAAEADAHAAAEIWLHAARTDPLDPAREPPFTWALLRLGSGKTIWSQIYHHVAIDSTGRDLLVARLASIYSALVRGCDPPAPSPAPDFASLVARENAYFASRQAADDLKWCLSEIDGPPPLPSPSRRAAASGDPGFHRASRTVSADMMEALNRQARRLGITLPQLLCAAWAAFLARISGNEEILIGLQVAGRSAATRESIATLTNLVPLRLRTPPTTSFDQYATEAGRQVRAALRHQHHPHQRTRAALGLSPIAPDPLAIGFNYAPRASSVSLPGTAITTRNLAHGPVQELSLGVEPCADGAVHLDLDANQQRYTVGETDQLVDRLVLLLQDLVRTDGGVPVSQLAICRPEEQRRALAMASCGQAPLEDATTLAELATLRHPNNQSAPALVAGDARLSYAMLDSAVNRMARHLIGRGIGPGKVVALALPRTQTLVIALLAVCRTGGAFCPLDPEHPPARRAHMLDASQASLLLTTGVTARAISTVVPVLCLDTDVEQAAVARCSPAPVTDATRTEPLRPDMLAYVIFTSGSTGSPKAVAIPHASICRALRALADSIPMQLGQTLLSVTTIAFDVALADVFLPLLQGGVLVLLPESVLRDPIAVCRALRQHRVSVMQATPSYWRTLPLADLPPSLCAVLGGEDFPVDLLPRLASIRDIVNVYGPTETTIWATAHRVRPGDARDGIMPVGRPLPGYLIWILDREGTPVPPGLPGELYIGGLALADGYLRDTDLTNKRFISCPFAEGRMYRTGDLARWRKDGLIEILGRADSQLKINGHRVEPGEIEHAIRLIPGVADAAVVLHEEHARPILTAYVAVAPGVEPLDREALRRALADRLPVWMLPGACVNLDRLPRNATGKLDRAALRAVAPQATLVSRPPVNRDEALLCDLFAKLCNAERVGAEDDFFDLGGDSLGAMLLVTELRQHGRALSLQLLFERRTPAGIAAAWAAAADQSRAALSPRTVFLIPGMGGDAPAIAKLRLACAGRIDMMLLDFPDWPVLALPDYGMAQLADAFAARIEALAPSGVIRLAGYSLGGPIAWQVACLLTDRGREVGFLGLLDCATEEPERQGISPAGWLRAAVWDAHEIISSLRTGRCTETFSSVLSRRLVRKASHRYGLHGLAKLRGLPIPVHLRYWLHRHVSEALHAEIIRRWRVDWSRTKELRDLPTVLFRAESRTGLSKDLGWSDHCRSVEIITVAGGHQSMLTDDRLDTLADAIVRAVLDLGCQQDPEAAGRHVPAE